MASAQQCGIAGDCTHGVLAEHHHKRVSRIDSGQLCGKSLQLSVTHRLAAFTDYRNPVGKPAKVPEHLTLFHLIHPSTLLFSPSFFRTRFSPDSNELIFRTSLPLKLMPKVASSPETSAI